MPDIQTDHAQHTEAMLAVHELCGRLINELPPGALICSWELMEGYLGGQYSTMASWNGAKRGLALLANTFGLTYDEETLKGIVRVDASGEIDGIKVQLWAHLDMPRKMSEAGD